MHSIPIDLRALHLKCHFLGADSTVSSGRESASCLALYI